MKKSLRKNIKIEYILIIPVAIFILALAAINLTTAPPLIMHHMMVYYNNNYYILTNYLLIAIAIILLVYPILKEIGNKESESSYNRDTTEQKYSKVVLEEDIENNKITVHKEESKDVKENIKILEVVKKLLNEDEAKIMEIIFENEGITQDSLHFRTGFSHSKLSMIIKKLEEKDLIVREKFGKTYKIYLSEWLKKTEENRITD